LDVPQLDSAFGAPAQESISDQFRAILQAQRLRLSSPGHDLIEHPDHPLRWERRIHFDRQRFSDTLIQHI